MKQQTAPNKDIQKEIADMTEVNGVLVIERLQHVPIEQLNMSVLSAVDRHSSDLPVAEGRDEGNPKGPEEDHGRPGPQLQGRHPEESPGKDQ